LIIVAVAIYNVFTKFSSGVKFESISGLFRIPSGLYRSNTSTPSGFSVNSSANNSTSSTKPAVTPPAGFTVNDLSPYYGQVKIGSVYYGSSWGYSQFTLSAGYSLTKPIDITGWHLKSNAGYVLVPTAVSNYNPGGTSPSADIVLNSNQHVNFYSNVSPLVTNLRMNKCIGYLNNTYKFNPPMPNNCPSLYSRSEISSFSGACQNLIISLWSCSTPDPDDLNKLSAYSDQACKNFINSRFSYNGCYNYHKNDADFLSNEWRVWLSGLLNFDPSHDKIDLFDRSGLLVDEYIY
jgi:hypothetical protein